MNRRYLIIGLFFNAVILAEEIPRAIQVIEPPADVPKSDAVSSSTGQFRVSGGTNLLRGTVAMMAEETKSELLRLTGERDDWKIPVGVLLHGKQGDPLPPRTVVLGLLEIAGVSQLKLDVHLSHGIDHEPFKRAITSALLYERALHKESIDSVDRSLSVPPWLADGLLEATAWRLNQSDRRLYEAVFKSGLFKIDGLLGMDSNEFEALDAATRAAFRVSSGALVMALLEQPQGREGFCAFLTDAAAYEGEMPSLLRKHFPELNLSETSLEKWWALQLAAKGGTNVLTDTLSISKTEEALGAALMLDFPTEEGISQQKPLEAWPEIADLKEPERAASVRLAQDALVRLSYRCFPSYRPLLLEYQQVLDSIVKNKTNDVPNRLASLAETRTTMIARATRARDYLDFFEISRARETSGEFEDYLKLKERLKSQPRSRKDGVSSYLDKMDAIFYREEKKSRTPAPP